MDDLQLPLSAFLQWISVQPSRLCKLSGYDRCTGIRAIVRDRQPSARGVKSVNKPSYNSSAGLQRNYIKLTISYKIKDRLFISNPFREFLSYATIPKLDQLPP